MRGRKTSSRTLSGVVLIAILTGMLYMTFGIQRVEASGTIYIRADGSIDPPTANITSIDNRTFTFTDNNNDELVVERDNITIDGNGYSLQGRGSETGSLLDPHIGIDLNLRANVTIKNVEVTDFGRGIYIGGSSKIVLTNNSMSGNKYNFGLYGHDTYADYDHIIDETNTVDGKPIYYMKKVSNTIYDSSTNAGTLYLIDCNNITVRDLTLTKNFDGIFLWNTTNSKIQNVTALYSLRGIHLKHSSNNTLTGTNVFSTDEEGIYLENHSDSNNLTDNTVTDSLEGIQLDWYSDNNLITRNNISDSTNGIRLTFSSNNTVTNNTVTGNQVGISLEYSDNSFLILNNFMDNTKQVFCEYSTNVWDDGAKGNYWSDYEEKYPSANEADGSGIWDTPYVIDESNQDNYPIVPEFSSLLVLQLFMLTTLLIVLFYRRKHC